MTDDKALLRRFVQSFECFDNLEAFESDPHASALAVNGLDERGFGRWRPSQTTLGRDSLEALYAVLPFKLPSLYEQLILSYRWAEVDLVGYRLLANPPGEDLLGLLEEMRRDRIIFSTLVRHGYTQFAKGEDIDYDPVCFDGRRRTRDSDCAIVKLDHEGILCHERVTIVKELAPSFRELVNQTIAAPRNKKTSR
ncbi:MAG: hypothetical protein ACRD5G_11540 [Candidatus Acidiferrales bacterium]